MILKNSFQGRIQDFWKGGGNMYKGGGHFVDWISFFLNIP